MPPAVFPLGINSPYVSWKGSQINSNPVGTAPGHIRPLTNNDAGNVFQSGSSSSRTYSNQRVFNPRPIKHFRKGRSITTTPVSGLPIVTISHPHNSSQELTIDENSVINYNLNRFVSSNKGTGLINDLIDKPGAVIINENPETELNGITQLNINCQKFKGIGVVADYYPNSTFIQENPSSNTQNQRWCCNAEQKAKRRSSYASTNLNKNYYNSSKQYLQNRCKTFEQKSFNFLSYQKTIDSSIYQANAFQLTAFDPNYNPSNTIPGSPLSFVNTYLANCQPNAEIFDATQNALISQMLSIMLNNNLLQQTDVDAFNSLNITTILGFYEWLKVQINSQELIESFNAFINNPYWGMPLSGPSNPAGCQLVTYKPNNYKFAKQGAVDSSTRNLSLKVSTITTNAASIHKYTNTGGNLVNANQIHAGNDNNIMNLYKNKTASCNTSLPLNFRQSGPFQKKRFCYYNNLP